MKCPNCGCEIKKEARNLSQNALFHLWMRVLGEELGHKDLEDIKRTVKRHILGMREVVNVLTGEIEHEDYQTSSMTKPEMAKFMDDVKTWAMADLNVYLPYIGDPGYEELTRMGHHHHD